MKSNKMQRNSKITTIHAVIQLLAIMLLAVSVSIAATKTTQLSGYAVQTIQQQKQEIEQLTQQKQRLLQEIEQLNQQKQILEQKIQQLTQQNKEAMRVLVGTINKLMDALAQLSRQQTVKYGGSSSGSSSVSTTSNDNEGPIIIVPPQPGPDYKNSAKIVK